MDELFPKGTINEYCCLGQISTYEFGGRASIQRIEQVLSRGFFLEHLVHSTDSTSLLYLSEFPFVAELETLFKFKYIISKMPIVMDEEDSDYPTLRTI